MTGRSQNAHDAVFANPDFVLGHDDLNEAIGLS